MGGALKVRGLVLGVVRAVVGVGGAGLAAGPVFGAVVLLLMLVVIPGVPAEVVSIGDVGVEAALDELNVR